MADFKSDPEVMAQLQEVREAAQKVAQIKVRISHRDWGAGLSVIMGDACAKVSVTRSLDAGSTSRTRPRRGGSYLQ